MRDKQGTVEHEGAASGLFITLEPPTQEMQREAAAAGFYRSPGWQKDYPKIQILTIDDLMHHRADVRMPSTAITFKQAERVQEEEQQRKLEF